MQGLQRKFEMTLIALNQDRVWVGIQTWEGAEFSGLLASPGLGSLAIQ